MLMFIECKAKAETMVQEAFRKVLTFDGILSPRHTSLSSDSPFNLIFSVGDLSIAIDPFEENPGKGKIRLATKSIAKYLMNQIVHDKRELVKVEGNNWSIYYDLKNRTYSLYLKGKLEFGTAMTSPKFLGNEIPSFLYNQIKNGMSKEEKALLTDFEVFKDELAKLESKYGIAGSYIPDESLVKEIEDAKAKEAKQQIYKESYDEIIRTLPQAGL